MLSCETSVPHVSVQMCTWEFVYTIWVGWVCERGMYEVKVVGVSVCEGIHVNVFGHRRGSIDLMFHILSQEVASCISWSIAHNASLQPCLFVCVCVEVGWVW